MGSNFLCAYYTNPLIDVSLKQLDGDFWNDPRAEWTPYMRGFVYLLSIDALLRQAAVFPHAPNPIDEVVMSISRQQRLGKRTYSSTWLETLYPLLGRQAVDDMYHTLTNGGPMQLGTDITLSAGGHFFKLVHVRQEVFDLGFCPSALHRGEVFGLDAGSRAALAGLQNGDKIQTCTGVSKALQEFDAEVSCSVKRGNEDEELTVSFWPRGHKLVDSYKMVQTSVPVSGLRS